MKTKLMYCFLLVFSFVSLQAQEYKSTAAGFTVKAATHEVNVQFLSPKIVRVVKSPTVKISTIESLSVIKKPEKVKLTFLKSNGILTVKSTAITLKYNFSTDAISYYDIIGKELFTEQPNGLTLTAKNDAGKATYSVKQKFKLATDEVIYGLGQQQNGLLNQRNQKILLKQENTKVCIPFFQSIKGYGVFWDNYSPTTFTDNATETSFDAEVGNQANYYFLFGGSGDGVVAQMRDLTGQAPMMPLWVFGFSQSKERYKTQFEILNVVKKYRELQVPLDGIVQDWQYWGPDSNWNAMSFAPKIYPRPQEMVDSIHQLNAHLFIVSWPGFAPKTNQYQAFKAQNMLINFDTWPPGAHTKPYDVYNPKARDIYWDFLNKGIFKYGIDAWWLDSTEPDHINIKETDFDQPTHLGSYRSVHNAFPLEHTKGVYNHQRATSSAKRVILLTRSAFAGQQRYSSNTWSGDVSSNWETLKKQIPAALNFSLSGLPYWNGDIGGFFAGKFVKGGGAKNPEFQELYTRWMQFATFTPMMRSHGTDIPREIYQFGKRGDTIFDTQEKYINLRYCLLPYTYATAWQVTHNGGSFMRPLFSAFPLDKQGFENNTEFMYGQNFLVSPVTTQGIKEQAVYLPKGSTWIDFWTGEISQGGQTINKATTIATLPLFVKAGAIIPWGPKVQYATEKKWDDLEIRIYPGADGTFVLYEDENDNYNYEKGAYSEINFNWNEAKKQLTLSGKKGKYNGEINNRKFKLVLVNESKGLGVAASTQIDKVVEYKGKEMVIKL